MGGSCCCLAYVVGKNDIRDPLATKRSLLWAFGLLLTFIRHFKTDHIITNQSIYTKITIESESMKVKVLKVKKALTKLN